jgi:hypothetical protein
MWKPYYGTSESRNLSIKEPCTIIDPSVYKVSLSKIKTVINHPKFVLSTCILFSAYLETNKVPISSFQHKGTYRHYVPKLAGCQA